jgi:nucleoside phosphorylase
MTKSYVDIAFIVPLREEFDRLTGTFPIKKDFVEAPAFWAELDLGTSGVSAVAILQDAMGKAAATRATQKILAHYDVGFLAVVGIAGGLSGDVAIGDVCFTGPLFDVLENSKVSDSSKGRIRIEFNSIPFNTDSRLSFAIKYVSLGTDTKPFFEDWQLRQHYAAKEYIPGEFIGRKDKSEAIGLPQIHEGSIVCGAVSKSDVYKSNLGNLDRRLLAIETETGGVFSVAEPLKIPVVTIRGICDYADKNKNKLEEQTNAATRLVAASNAVSFVKLQLENPQMRMFLENRRGEIAGVAELARQKLALDELVPTALAALNAEVHLQLGQLSPEYKGKPAGYRLPLPRIKVSAANAAVSSATQNRDPQSILEAITKHRVILIGLPKTYPENSLPWIIASELSLIEVNGKQAVPLVVSGKEIRPPTGTLTRQTELNLAALNGRADARPIFILSDFPAESRSRIEHLKAQMELYPEGYFVIVNRNEGTSVDTTTLVVSTGAERFDLCDISFVELSSFFKRTFQLPDQEAGVIALRFQDMFKKFELNAHPSYFAGLSPEILSALLRANRRAELLQLAVSGFLSFVVAGDEDNVVLSRTTREVFLKRLVFETYVEKKSFNRPSLIQFVQDFASEKDFEIDSILFIKAFQDKGILHFDEQGHVQISLPFIGSYLLASELASRPKEAIKYFNLKSDDFDFPTFDLYCELNLTNEITENVIAEMNAVLEDTRTSKPNNHILLTNDIRPVLVDHPGRHRALEDQLQKAVEDVKTNRSNAAEKQDILDVAARVESRAREAQEAAKFNFSKKAVGLDESIDDSLRIWSISIVLLGSGSERLNREPKRELARLIVELSSVLIDKLLRSFPSSPFEGLRERLHQDDTLREVFSIPSEQPIPERHRALIDAVIDAYEFSVLGYPVRVVFEQLGNLAAQTVLRSSVSSVSPDDPMENLIARVWAAEIDAAKEKAALLDAINGLPVVPFLRYTLSTHFIARVFWNHWETANRLALLDAAEEALRPIAGTIDKGKVRRMISNKEDDDGE